MQFGRVSLFLALTVALAAPAAGERRASMRARLVVLEGIVPLAISPDGGSIVGPTSRSDGPPGPLVWRKGRVRPLDRRAEPGQLTFPIAASRGAKVVTDVGAPATIVRRGRRIALAETGEARDVSERGRFVVGYVEDDARQPIPVRWRRGRLEPLDIPGLAWGQADAVSADGRSVLGAGSFGNGATERFLWIDGEVTRIPGLPGSTGVPFNQGVSTRLLSSDGSTVVNYDPGSFSEPAQAWRWRDGPVEPLGSLGEGFDSVVPTGVSANGEVITGATSGPSEPLTAFLWDATHGVRSLTELVEALGADLQGLRLVSAEGLSDDGRHIVGGARDADGALHFYLVVLPPACSDGIDNDGDGRVDHGDDPDCRKPRSRSEASRR